MEVKRCKRCVMDNQADKRIRFDENGYCNYCAEAISLLNKQYFPDEKGVILLKNVLSEIKSKGKDKEYDCLMGISGGLDSSYLAYLGHKWKLRILGVHIDDGFDTSISKNNIKKLCKKAGIQLVIIKPDKEQYIDLIKAYMKAGVPNLAIPQDNILFAQIYRYAKEKGISYFLSGSNLALESILQRGNSYNAEDVVNIKAIHKKYGNKKIDRIELMSSYKKLYYRRMYHIQTVKPLNFIEYHRKKAFQELYDFCGFQYYGSKHLENIFTAFLQLYWLPKKFNVDKRTSHLSSMIISGQMTREEALQELKNPMYEKELMQEYLSIIKKEFQFSENEFNAIMKGPVHQHTEYNTEKILPIIRSLRRTIRKY